MVPLPFASCPTVNRTGEKSYGNFCKIADVVDEEAQASVPHLSRN